ncbi:SCP2 domain-containing protein [Pseudomonas daroniae]|uniref:Ubiquinone biosynthesis accessory factor UbiJ n=1 Tax=Phytopseudomonas daroniae TaxID=2487519 RepID=A0A4Q9QT74_9GAMM|nr:MULTISPECIES: SCP2 sterol-binding domain-containing protein [Pseudomonas]TBU71317.1 SCP2 domain-containing protein [Pseudomonas daroniae]TBU82981.1 SCP2 domain-containing protein [Pseudomonas sp. FRB 228]TBU84006.1 SCP2 domain-containing protein [Pseudomonas daroniae]TBU93184.1 SCP2 domain-containing protein [Pseudomonas daroniae]
MLTQALFAGVERGLNRVLALDSTALPRLARLNGRVIAVESRAPALQLFILADGEGLRLASQWAGEVDCTLRAPASALLRLALAKDKQAVLHEPEVDLDGDSGALMELTGVLQDLELDWEYELSRWLGPVATPLLAGHLRSRTGWTRDNLHSLQLSLADYLSEESRALVGYREAEARFAELDDLKLSLDRLDARIERLVQRHKPIA